MSESFHSAYVAGGMRGNAFLPRGAGDAAARSERTRAVASRTIPSALLAVLRAQNPSAPALPRSGTAVVVTGQQAGLFLGPLYTLYKAATAIAWARRLESETGVPCVPLFWLQTEDHDFAEIAHTCVPTTDGLLELHLAAAPERVSIAHQRLGPDIDAQLAHTARAIHGEPHAEATMALLREHYRAGEPIARAFAGVLGALFAPHGLVILDPRNPEVARLAAPVLATSLRETARIDAALAERGRALIASGYAEQIRPRPGSTLAFFHARSPEGPRHRLSADGDHFTDHTGERITREAALALVASEPLRFSTSALLRPIVQDVLLPTALYVGGPAELDYLAQASALYPIFDLPPPLVAARARLRLVTPRLRALLGKLGLTTADVGAQPGALTTARPQHGPGRTWLTEIEQRLDELARTEPQLLRATEKTRRSLHRAVDALQRRADRHSLERDTITARRLARLKDWLVPHGEPQERVHSFVAYAARVGPAALVSAILNAVDPLDPRLRDCDL